MPIQKSHTKLSEGLLTLLVVVIAIIVLHALQSFQKQGHSLGETTSTVPTNY